MNDDSASDAARVHRALASPVRGRLLSVLRAGVEPQDVQRLAGGLGLHPNTVRVHLTVLERAGLVTSRPEGRDRPGRPRLVYRAADPAPDADTESTGGTGSGEGADGADGADGAEGATAHGYRFLSEVLASYLAATAPDPSGAAEEAGTAWGRHIVDRPGPFQTLAPEAAIGRVVAMLDELGFAPDLDAGDPAAPRVLLRRCPFLDVAREHQQVVCGIHLGLMRGALDELGAEVEARELLPFVEPGLCVSHLGVPA